jgi:hypothetical protein
MTLGMSVQELREERAPGAVHLGDEDKGLPHRDTVRESHGVQCPQLGSLPPGDPQQETGRIDALEQ